jgi:hypothetical protein
LTEISVPTFEARIKAAKYAVPSTMIVADAAFGLAVLAFLAIAYVRAASK